MDWRTQKTTKKRTQKVEQNGIHPKILGLNLSGTLIKTLAGAVITALIAVVRFIFIA